MKAEYRKKAAELLHKAAKLLRQAGGHEKQAGQERRTPVIDLAELEKIARREWWYV